MNKWVKRGIALSVFFIGWRSISLFCTAQTEGFSLLRIQPDFALVPTERSLVPCDELSTLLSQPFYYLARGGQCFAFVSEDGKVVIKFFHHHLYKPYSFLFKIPLPLMLKNLVEKKLNKHLSKIKKERASYKLAYWNLQEESGILCVHWGKPFPGKRKITLIDKLGIKHSLDLNGVEFVVQKKVDPLPCVLDRLTKDRDEEGLKLAIRGIVRLIVSYSQKGIFDEDPGLHRNIGFDGNTPLVMDVGKLVRNPLKAAAYKEQLPLITARFRYFLETSYPNLVSTLDEEVLAVCCDN